MLAWDTGDGGSEAQSNPSSLTRPPLSEWLWRRVSEYLHDLRYCVERENVRYPMFEWGWEARGVPQANGRAKDD